MKTPIPQKSPGINVAVIRNIDNVWQYLLLKRASDETYDGFWGLLSGSRENNESVTNLALREMMEEISIRPQSLWASEYCVQFFEPLDDSIWTLPVLVAFVEPTDQVVLDEENQEFRWLSVEAAIELAPWRNLKQVLVWLEEDLKSFPPVNWVRMPFE